MGCNKTSHMKIFKILLGVLLIMALLMIPFPGYCQTSGNKVPVLTAGTAISIWPGTAPGEKGNIGEEKDNTKPTDGKVAGKDVIRIGNVSKPTITIYQPKKGANGSAVIVCPGGGYSILALDLEGTEV